MSTEQLGQRGLMGHPARPTPDGPVPDQNRLDYADAVRVFGSLAVVVAHVACEATQLTFPIDAASWWYCSLIDAASRWAVPAFIMVSGALLLGSERQGSMVSFYRRRLARVGIPLLFWSVVFLVWRVVVRREQLPPAELLGVLLSGKPYYHLHFVAGLLGLYLFTPMLRVFVRHAEASHWHVLIASTLVMTAGYGLVTAGADSDPSASGTVLDRFLKYLALFLTGYYLRNVRLSGAGLAGAWAVFAASVLVTAGGTAWLLDHLPEDPRRLYFYEQLSLTRFSAGIAAFLILAHLFRSPPRSGWLGRLGRDWLAPASFGIYLVHPLFIEVAARARLDVSRPNFWIGLPLTSLAVFAASAAFVIVWLRLPYLRRLVGAAGEGRPGYSPRRAEARETAVAAGMVE